MDFRFSDEQEELRDIARAFLDEHAGSEALRKAMETDLGFDPALWDRIAGELGWTAVHVPEAYGGLGLGYVELVALLEIMGGALLAAPFFSSVCLAANALMASGDTDQQAAHLPGIAEGRTRATLGFSGTRGTNDPDAVAVTARRAGDGFVLDGEHAFVLDGHSADWLVVAARTPGTTGAEGLSLLGVPGDAPGLTRTRRPTVDQSRRLARVVLDGVRLPASALIGVHGEAAPILERTLQLAAVALAAEQVGGAQRCLDLSVAHALERVQFGRAIGSFQAIKHKCADMMVAIESARSAAYYAACVATESSPELPACASLAKAYASETYFRCAADAIQIHGGVGFTWEYDVHLHFKRARASEAWLGDPAWHRERVARLIGL
jgi:alkylation response protein AidB-like acyl-CoA dehydrogenase